MKEPCGISNPHFLLCLKKAGFSDLQIGFLCQHNATDVRKMRISENIYPWIKQIDTLAAEYPAKTNYLYCSYNAMEHDVTFDESSVMVLGCGPYHIGSSVEFDWCGVSCIRTLGDLGKRTIVINNNPETVSTDFDECERLYFEELTTERVMDIYETENCDGMIVSVGGQIPNNLALPLHRNGVKVFGTSPHMIDNAENRAVFSGICDTLNIGQPEWRTVSTTNDALDFAAEVGYPCLLRPSYVLSGSAMNVIYTPHELQEYLKMALNISTDYAVVITKFYEDAKEIEMDGVANNGKVICHAICEHVEHAGVHSGDATILLPTQTIEDWVLLKIRRITKKIASHFQICGPFNMQFLVKDSKVMVIELNLRASRTCPFVSKAMYTDFIAIATRTMLGMPIQVEKQSTLRAPRLPSKYVGIKVPMFSWPRLKDADPLLKCEMASTGEVASFGSNMYTAFLKAITSSGINIPIEGSSVLVGVQKRSLHHILPIAKKLLMHGFHLYATEKTASFLNMHYITAATVSWPIGNSRNPAATRIIQNGAVDLVINLPNQLTQFIKENYNIRRAAIDSAVPLITNLEIARLLVESLDYTGHVKSTSLLDYKQE